MEKYDPLWELKTNEEVRYSKVQEDQLLRTIDEIYNERIIAKEVRGGAFSLKVSERVVDFLKNVKHMIAVIIDEKNHLAKQLRLIEQENAELKREIEKLRTARLCQTESNFSYIEPPTKQPIVKYEYSSPFNIGYSPYTVWCSNSTEE